MALTPLGPLPTPTDAATFDSRMDSFINTQLPRMVTEVDVISAAFNFNATNATSSTSLLIGTGSKFLMVAASKSYLGGMYIVVADAAAPSTNSMFGQVTSYNAGTGALVFNSLSTTGSGTKTSWVISQGQVLQYGGQDALTTAGTAPNYTATPTPALTDYVANKIYPVFFHAAGTTGSNAISFSGLGNRNLKQLDSSGTKIPAIIPAPMGSYLLYDGTDFILLDPLPVSPVGGVRQTVQAAPVDTAGLPNFLPATSSGTTLTSTGVSSASPIVVNAAGGGGTTGLADRVGVSTSNLVWTGCTITNAVKNYFYVDVSANGTLTTGSTTVAPVYQQGGTPAVTSGLLTFNYGEMRGYIGNGSSAPQGYRVYVGEGTGNGTNVASIIAYALNGFYDSGFTATLPAGGTLTSKNHNIGVSEIYGVFIRECTTIDLGYAVGDRIISVPGGFESTNYHPDNINTTALTISLSKSGIYYSSNKSGAAGGYLTVGSWKYKFIAQRAF